LPVITIEGCTMAVHTLSLMHSPKVIVWHNLCFLYGQKEQNSELHPAPRCGDRARTLFVGLGFVARISPLHNSEVTDTENKIVIVDVRPIAVKA